MSKSIDQLESHLSKPRAVKSPLSATGQPIRVVLSWIPSLVVIAALLGLASYGHRTDWRLPSFASLTKASPATSSPSWCDSHGVSEPECIVCNPGLIEAAVELEFCRQHGVHGCVLCNPSLAETKQPTSATLDDLERAQRALDLKPRVENLAISDSPGSRIQFASIEAMNKAAVDVEPVERRRITETISAASEILYDATKTAQVSPQADGIVRRVLVEVGDWVVQGQVLALIDSSEAGRLKTELLAALSDEQLRRATVDRLRPLAGQAIAGKRLLESENELQQATAAVDRAAGTLGNLGIRVDLAYLRGLDQAASDTYVRRLGMKDVPDEVIASDTNNGNWIAVLAPLEGQVVRRVTTVGEVVDRGAELFRLVDTRTVWLDLRVSAEDSALVKLGQAVTFLPDGQRNLRTGSVTWISTELDPQTRTVRVRAELDNTDQSLRNESFGQGQVVLRDESDAIVIPESALQWDGTGHVVFVRDASFFDAGRPKFFVTRSVRAGVRQDGFVEIIAGVLPGEVVASSGSEVLRAQLLRSNLGAGCTCGQ